MTNSPNSGGNSLRRSMFLIAFGVIVYWLLMRIEVIYTAVDWFVGVVSPVLIGFGIAFLINLPMSFFERTIFARLLKGDTRLKKGLRRALSMLLAYSVVIAFIISISAFVLPTVTNSVAQLASNFTQYVTNFQVLLDGVMSTLSLDPDFVPVLANLWDMTTSFLETVIVEVVPQAVSFTIDVTSGIFTFLLSAMISLYTLANKDSLRVQIMRFIYAVFGKTKAVFFKDTGVIAYEVFSRFVVGQLTEAIILGILCFVGMSLFEIPYAMLISTVIAITALVPIVGPVFGTIPCTIIILVIDPAKAFVFLAFVVILQQLEGNIIYPRVVGNAIGLSGLWVLASILVGGGLFGAVGMLLGVPTFALVYRLTRKWVEERERKNKHDGILSIDELIKTPEERGKGKY